MNYQTVSPFIQTPVLSIYNYLTLNPEKTKPYIHHEELEEDVIQNFKPKKNKTLHPP